MAFFDEAPAQEEVRTIHGCARLAFTVETESTWLSGRNFENKCGRSTPPDENSFAISQMRRRLT